MVPELSAIRWHNQSGRNGKEYVVGRCQGKPVLMHRLIMGASGSLMIDHKNNDGYDNRRENLRFATRSQNQQNRRKNIKSENKFKGVNFRRDGGVWRARITANGKRITLGNFKTQELAAAAFADAAAKYHGDFARTD